MNPGVDTYFEVGCGRCPLGGTPDCKVLPWVDILHELRRILLDCGLSEEIKWGVPCYTIDGKNVILMSTLKACATLSFMNGVLLDDPHNLLEKPGPNSRQGRYMKFTKVSEVLKNEEIIKKYIFQAIENEKSGKKADLSQYDTVTMPEELEAWLEQDPVLRDAFYALTPGRQRGYLIHFSGAKQSATRISRIERCIPDILNGKGLHDRY